MVAKLDEAQRAALLPALTGWTHEPTRDGLARRYVFADFVAAFGFMAKVALLAEKGKVMKPRGGKKGGKAKPAPKPRAARPAAAAPRPAPSKSAAKKPAAKTARPKAAAKATRPDRKTAAKT